VSTPTETEVKLCWRGTPAEAQALFASLGYAQQEPRSLESDQLFDRENGELRGSDRLLRLRRVGDRATVTYKGPADRQVYKSREEIEFDVSDAGAYLLVLDRLGYRPGFRYEKYRTKFARTGESGIITLDETPVGVYLELEGPREWIDSTSAVLGFTRQDYLTASYAALYRNFRESHPDAPPDMLFH
jgi:adenylate cyclase, class 2